MKLPLDLNATNKTSGDETDCIAYGWKSSTSLNHLPGELSSQQFVHIGKSPALFSVLFFLNLCVCGRSFISASGYGGCVQMM